MMITKTATTTAFINVHDCFHNTKKDSPSPVYYFGRHRERERETERERERDRERERSQKAQS
jgi:hypothetical protein